MDYQQRLEDAYNKMLGFAINKMNAECRAAPSVKDVPQSEIDRIEADPDVVGWVKNPYGKGHVYLRGREFFSPTQPFTAEQWNLKFNTKDFRWHAACGHPIAHYLNTAGKWARAQCFMTQAVIDAVNKPRNEDLCY